jgi:hypothetical protein
MVLQGTLAARPPQIPHHSQPRPAGPAGGGSAVSSSPNLSAGSRSSACSARLLGLRTSGSGTTFSSRAIRRSADLATLRAPLGAVTAKPVEMMTSLVSQWAAINSVIAVLRKFGSIWCERPNRGYAHPINWVFEKGAAGQIQAKRPSVRGTE